MTPLDPSTRPARRARPARDARRLAALAFAALLSTACGGGAAPCPDGSVPREGRCVLPDAASDSALPDADADADVDAGACGGGCRGAAPVCDEARGACVQCLGASDCRAAASPLCDTTGKAREALNAG